jgi:WD repeat-containing protein 61
MIFYDLATKKEVHRIDPGMLEAWSICLSPADDVLASGNRNGEINIWSMGEDHEKVASLATSTRRFILSTAFSVQGMLACTGIDGAATLFDLNTQQAVHRLSSHSLPVRDAAFSPEGTLLFTASDDRHVSVYDVRSGATVSSFSHQGMALSVDASIDHRHFVVGCSDHSVCYWDLGMQRCVTKLSSSSGGNHCCHGDQVWGVAFDKSSNAFCEGFKQSNRLISVGDDAAIQLYT